MTEELKQKALAFIENVYNAGFREGSNARQEEPGSSNVEMTEEVIVFLDGAEYSGDTTKFIKAFTYSRKFANTKWGTLMLPVALDYADWKDKFEIAEIVGVEVGTSIVAKRKVLGVGSQTEPNRPYLIRAKKSSSSAQSITRKYCFLYPAIEGSVAFTQGDKTYTFHGSYKSMTTSDLAGKYYASGGVFVQATGSLKPMRVYLNIEQL